MESSDVFERVQGSVGLSDILSAMAVALAISVGAASSASAGGVVAVFEGVSNGGAALEFEHLMSDAKAGSASAQFNVGILFATGLGVPQDYSEAAKWYRKAADAGLSAAEFNIGGLYRFGWGLPQGFTLAARWFRKAAEKGYVPAQYRLGVMYKNGEGVPRDLVEAQLWFSLAANEGDVDAMRGRNLVRTLLKPKEDAAVKVLITEWTAAHKQHVDE